MGWEYTLDLEPHIGEGYDGNPVEHPQWFIVVQGKRIGILPFEVGSTIMPINGGVCIAKDKEEAKAIWGDIRQRLIAKLNWPDVGFPMLDHLHGVVDHVTRTQDDDEDEDDE